MKKSLSGLTVAYMFLLMNLILVKQENLHKNSSLYGINTRNKNLFRRIDDKFTLFLEKGILMLALNIKAFAV